MGFNFQIILKCSLYFLKVLDVQMKGNIKQHKSPREDPAPAMGCKGFINVVLCKGKGKHCETFVNMPACLCV